MTIDTLEANLLPLREKADALNKYLTMRGADSVKKIKQITNLFFPGIEKECRLLLEDCSAVTVEFGHSKRLDFVKDTAFNLLGKALGEEL